MSCVVNFLFSWCTIKHNLSIYLHSVGITSSSSDELLVTGDLVELAIFKRDLRKYSVIIKILKLFQTEIKKSYSKLGKSILQISAFYLMQ